MSAGIPVLMLVDDDADWLSIAVRALAPLRCLLAVANDARIAVQLISEGGVYPTLVLMDLHMPSMNGWRVIEALRQDEHTRHIPLVCVTGARDVEAAGCVKTFRKPVELNELVRFCQRYVAPRPEL